MSDSAHAAPQRLAESLRRVIRGKEEALDLALVCLLARGHLLIEDVPGVGKTTLARALARSFSGAFRRIQFTPDLLPSDITGVSVYDQRESVFRFRPGPLFGNVILADELNRTPPRTQSALLEAMNEAQVSVEGETRALPKPFFVIATQNPSEFAGTYPLPESQLDRFTIRLRLGYPDPKEEAEILEARRESDPLDGLVPVLSPEGLLESQEAASRVKVDRSLVDYVVAIAGRSRAHPEVTLPISPRGTLALFHAAQARAFLAGRAYVIPDDVVHLAKPVLAHRMRCRATANEAVVEEILSEIPVPR